MIGRRARDCNRRKPVPVAGAGARVLAVGCDHPAIRGAVIAFVTERSCRRRAWLLLLGEGESRQGPTGTDMLTSAFAESTRAPRPAAAAYPGPEDGRLLAVERMRLVVD